MRGGGGGDDGERGGGGLYSGGERSGAGACGSSSDGRVTMDAVMTAESAVERARRETGSEMETAWATEVAALKAALRAPRATTPPKACSNVRRSAEPSK